MKFGKLAAVPLLSLLVLNLAHSKPKKPQLPAVFQIARYVYVQAEDGDILKPSLFPEDRQAISDVQERLRDWHRYAVTLNRGDADLVFVVRKGRLAATQLHGGISGGSRSQPRGPSQTGPGSLPGPGETGGTEIGVRGEVGPPDDLLRIYIQHEGELTSKVWERSLDGGLDAPAVRLVQQLKEAVDRAYPQSPNATKKP